MQHFFWNVNYSSVYFCNLSAVALIIDSAGLRPMTSFFHSAIIFILLFICFSRRLVAIRGNSWLWCVNDYCSSVKCENQKLHQSCRGIYVFYLYDDAIRSADDPKAIPTEHICAARNLFCFSRAAFHSSRVEDTHLNEIVLLFNGDVNYSAVKTSHETHKNLFKFRARRINISSSDNN
jgi:hypothetical protein